jgi:hypothetical protein
MGYPRCAAIASRSEAATGARLCEAPLDAMFCRVRADVAQPVEQRFRNPRFAPRDKFTSSHSREHGRP